MQASPWNSQQGPHEPNRRIRRGRIRWTHATEAHGPCATQEAHEEKLGLIIGMMRQRNVLTAVFPRRARQKRVPQPSCRGFDRFLRGAGFSADVSGPSDAWDLQPRGRLLDESAVRIGIGAA
jgi:hypothetical protein